MKNMTAFVLLMRGTPVKGALKVLHERDILTVVYKSYDLGKAKQLILECDFIAYWSAGIDEWVRILLEYARENGKDTVTIEWIKRNLAKR